MIIDTLCARCGAELSCSFITRDDGMGIKNSISAHPCICTDVTRNENIYTKTIQEYKDLIKSMAVDLSYYKKQYHNYREEIYYLKHRVETPINTK